MKKTVIALLVILIPATLFAGFGLVVGGDINYAKSVSEMKDESNKFAFSDLSFNAEARANVSFWEIDLALGAGKNKDYPAKTEADKSVAYFFKSLKYEGLLTTGLHFDIKKVARFGITVGEKLTAVVEDNKLVFKDANGVSVTFANALKKSDFVTRITADGRIGNVLVGATATSDLGFSIDGFKKFKQNFDKSTYFKNVLNSTKFGVFVGIELF